MPRPTSSEGLGFVYGTAIVFLAVGFALGAAIAAALGWRF